MFRAARPRSRSQSFPAEASQVDTLPPSFSHLYRGQNKASSQPFQLGIATQVRLLSQLPLSGIIAISVFMNTIKVEIGSSFEFGKKIN